MTSPPSAQPAPGRRVRLIPFTEQHISDTYLAWMNHKPLLRYSRQRLRHHTQETSLAYLATFAASPGFFWAIERIADGLHIGSMTMHVDTISNTADMGIMVGHPQAIGHGFGAEAWGLALRFGFEHLHLRKITGGTTASNTAMTRIFERWRMVREGVQRGQELLDDGPVDILLYGLLRREWEAAVISPEPAC